VYGKADRVSGTRSEPSGIRFLEATSLRLAPRSRCRAVRARVEGGTGDPRQDHAPDRSRGRRALPRAATERRGAGLEAEAGAASRSTINKELRFACAVYYDFLDQLDDRTVFQPALIAAKINKVIAGVGVVLLALLPFGRCWAILGDFGAATGPSASAARGADARPRGASVLVVYSGLGYRPFTRERLAYPRW